MKKLLLATDMTSDVEFALEYGIRLASVIDAEVCILHVYMPQVMSVDGMIVTSPESIDLRKEAFEMYISELNKRYEPFDVTISHRYEVGFPAKKIIEVADEISAFAIVMATSRPTMMKHWLGSVSTEVMRHAQVPILLVPPHTIFSGLDKIAYADDFSSNHDIGLPHLRLLVTEFLSDVHLVHIGKKIQPESNWLEVDDLEQQFHGVDFKKVLLADSDIAEAMAEYARTNEIKLIIVPSPKRGMIYQLFHKSISRDLSLRSEVPMLVIH